MYADPTRKLYDAIGARTSTEKATGPATYGHDAGILSSIRAIWVCTSIFWNQQTQLVLTFL